ncbi:hypothetical protein JCM6882_002236 [Rhodosporidiobolus microsporus]
MPDEPGFKVTNKLVIDWKIDKINPALAAAKAGEERTFKVRCASFAFVALNNRGKNAADKHAGAFLYASPEPADYRRSSAISAWSPGLTLTFQLNSMNGYPLVRPLKLEDKIFDSSAGWGSHGIASWDVLSNVHVVDKNAFRLVCTIEGPNLPSGKRSRRTTYSPERSSSDVLRKFYGDSDHADVVFRVDPPEGKASHILALQKILKLKSYKFIELFEYDKASREAIDFPLKDAFVEPEMPYSGDVGEFAAFEADLLSKTDGNSGADERDKPSFAARRADYSRTFPRHESSQGTPEPTNDEDDGEGAQAAREGSEEPAKKKRKASREETRSMMQVKIDGCSFATLDALLHYLYSEKLTLLPPTSDYLVALRSCSDPSDLMQRDEWLEAFTLHLRNSTHACEPHALYRLAQKFHVLDLKERVKGYLLRSLTVENAAYELFSQLSFDFSDYQKPVLAFTLENWDLVKTSLALQHVVKVLESGKLPSAGKVLSQLFGKLEAGGEEGGKKEKKDDERAVEEADEY